MREPAHTGQEDHTDILRAALEVGVDDLLCDSLTTAGTPIIENKLAALLSDCSDYEIKMLSEIISNLKSTIRKFNQNKSY